MNEREERLRLFGQLVNWNLAIGPLADFDLPVTDDDGGKTVIVALDDEPLSALAERIADSGGNANLFVRRSTGVVSCVAVMSEACALGEPADEMTGPCDRPCPDSTVGMFVEHVKANPGGVLVALSLGRGARASESEELALVGA